MSALDTSLARESLNGVAQATLTDLDTVRDAIESMNPIELHRLQTAASALVKETVRAQAVLDELDQVMTFDLHSPVAALIDDWVRESARRQAAALEVLLPSAAKRGHGVAVIVDDAGAWRVQDDPEMPPMHVAHRVVNALPSLAGDERSTDGR